MTTQHHHCLWGPMSVAFWVTHAHEFIFLLTYIQSFVSYLLKNYPDYNKITSKELEKFWLPRNIDPRK